MQFRRLTKRQQRIHAQTTKHHRADFTAQKLRNCFYNSILNALLFTSRTNNKKHYACTKHTFCSISIVAAASELAENKTGFVLPCIFFGKFSTHGLKYAHMSDSIFNFSFWNKFVLLCGFCQILFLRVWFISLFILILVAVSFHLAVI